MFGWLREWWNQGKKYCPSCPTRVMHERPDGTFWCPVCHVIMTTEEFQEFREPFNL